MARQVLRPPDWWFWPKDWINEIKARKGWTDKDLANYLGVGPRTVLYLKKEPWNRSGELILKLFNMRNKTMQGGKSVFLRGFFRIPGHSGSGHSEGGTIYHRS